MNPIKASILAVVKQTGRIMNEGQKMSLWQKQSMSGLITALLAVLLLAVVGGFVACGDGNDDPADCNADQYYNESTGRCTVCGAVEEPECAEGCGFSIVKDDRGCPVAECAAMCDLCEKGEVFSEESLSCVAGETSP